LSATGTFRPGRMSSAGGSIRPSGSAALCGPGSLNPPRPRGTGRGSNSFAGPGRDRSDANQWANAIGWDVLTRADTAAGRGVSRRTGTARGRGISTGGEKAASWDISTGADTAACGALLGKPALRFGATVKRDGITTTAKQASNATVASMFPELK